MLSPSEHFQVASAAVPIECQSPSTSNEEESTLLSPNSAKSIPSQDTSDRYTPNLSNRANNSSGASTPCNPLPAAGLIPKRLEDILQVPVRKEKKIS